VAVETKTAVETAVETKTAGGDENGTGYGMGRGGDSPATAATIDIAYGAAH
jgi:hypothetical protein